jgi:hypothetical protein
VVIYGRFTSHAGELLIRAEINSRGGTSVGELDFKGNRRAAIFSLHSERELVIRESKRTRRTGADTAGYVIASVITHSHI